MPTHFNFRLAILFLITLTLGYGADCNEEANCDLGLYSPSAAPKVVYKDALANKPIPEFAQFIPGGNDLVFSCEGEFPAVNNVYKAPPNGFSFSTSGCGTKYSWKVKEWRKTGVPAITPIGGVDETYATSMEYRVGATLNGGLVTGSVEIANANEWSTTIRVENLRYQQSYEPTLDINSKKDIDNCGDRKWRYNKCPER